MRKIHWFILIVILLFPAIGSFFYPYMPDQMGTHWGFGAEPDGYASKLAGTFGTAIFLIILTGIFLVSNILMTRAAAKQNNKKGVLFFDSLLVITSVYLFVIYLAILIWNAGVKFHMPVFIVVSVIALPAVIIGSLIYIFVKKGEDTNAVSMPMVSDGRYRDRLVEIAGGKIVFKNYYFPSGSKTVELCDVEYVLEKPCTLRNGKWRLHGTGDLLFRIWFAADYERPTRDKIFVLKIKGKWIKIGFTVENSQQVSQVFENLQLIKAG